MYELGFGDAGRLEAERKDKQEKLGRLCRDIEDGIVELGTNHFGNQQLCTWRCRYLDRIVARGGADE